MRKNYFISDVYLIFTHLFIFIFFYILQNDYPYVARNQDGMFIIDTFICFIFAFQSALFAWIGLNRLTTQDKLHVPVFRKLVLGCFYGISITFIMLTVSNISFFHNSEIIKILLTFILFFGSVYFSILHYASFKRADYFGILTIFLITIIYFTHAMI